MVVVAGRSGCCGWLGLSLGWSMAGGGTSLLFLVATVKVAARGGVGSGGVGRPAACSSLPLHYVWLTYFSGAKWRRRESWEEYRAKSQADSGPLASGAGCVIA